MENSYYILKDDRYIWETYYPTNRFRRVGSMELGMYGIKTTAVYEHVGYVNAIKHLKKKLKTAKMRKLKENLQKQIFILTKRHIWDDIDLC